MRQLLRLDPDADEFDLVFGSSATNDREVAVLTRSLLHQMATMAAEVEAPAEDVSQGRASPGWDNEARDAHAVRLIQMRSSKNKPTDAFVTVHYRDHWFWIDDRDLKSKRVFSFMMMWFTLADTGEKEPLPLITIPAPGRVTKSVERWRPRRLRPCEGWKRADLDSAKPARTPALRSGSDFVTRPDPGPVNSNHSVDKLPIIDYRKAK